MQHKKGPTDISSSRHISSNNKNNFYLNDVDIESGPFMYSPGSHKLGIKKIISEYWNSVLNKDKCIRYKNNIFTNFFKSREIPLIGQANSLIITNTNGFHRRSVFKKFWKKNSKIFI